MMQQLTLTRFLELAESEFRAVRQWNPDYRLGQAYANTLHLHAPKVMLYLQGLGFDCYYDDTLIPEFLANVGAILENGEDEA